MEESKIRLISTMMERLGAITKIQDRQAQVDMVSQQAGRQTIQLTRLAFLGNEAFVAGPVKTVVFDMQNKIY